MSEQASLEDYGEELARRGQAAVLANTDPEWKDAAAAAIRHLAAGASTFTAEEVRALVGDPPGHPNAMGAALRAAANQGIIRRTDRWRKPARASRHGAVIRIWQGT